MSMCRQTLLPAHAGVILVFPLQINCAFTAPRACGGDPVQLKDSSYPVPCSPRMRG